LIANQNSKNTKFRKINYSAILTKLYYR